MPRVCLVLVASLLLTGCFHRSQRATELYQQRIEMMEQRHADELAAVARDGERMRVPDEAPLLFESEPLFTTFKSCLVAANRAKNAAKDCVDAAEQALTTLANERYFAGRDEQEVDRIMRARLDGPPIRLPQKLDAVFEMCPSYAFVTLVEWERAFRAVHNARIPKLVDKYMNVVLRRQREETLALKAEQQNALNGAYAADVRELDSVGSSIDRINTQQRLERLERDQRNLENQRQNENRRGVNMPGWR